METFISGLVIIYWAIWGFLLFGTLRDPMWLCNELGYERGTLRTDTKILLMITFWPLLWTLGWLRR